MLRLTPPANHTQHTEAASDSQQHSNMLEIGCGGGIWYGKVRSRDESEEENETDEDQHERNVNSQSADEEDEADKTPARELVRSTNHSRQV